MAMTELAAMNAPEVNTRPAKPHLPDAQIVTQVTHWTDRLFSFRVDAAAILAVPLGRVRDDRADG